MGNKAVFILNSPFQAMCAVEAISHYQLHNPSFFVFDCKDSIDKTKAVISSCSGDVCIVPHVGTVFLLKWIKEHINTKYDLVFVGDYFSYNQYLLAVSVCNSKSRIVYLDDGTSTLDLLPPVCRKRTNALSKRKLSYIFFNFLAKLKKVQYSFFSIFDLSPLKNMNVEVNTLSLWKRGYETKRLSDYSVFIIGTNSSILSIKDGCYYNLLEKTIKYIRQDYPTENIYYCPHRRDTNDLSLFLENNDLQLFPTKISVEVDFLRQNIVPQLIVGFASTALLTLKSIYHDARVCSVHFEDMNCEITKSIHSIESYYGHNQIEILDL